MNYPSSKQTTTKGKIVKMIRFTFFRSLATIYKQSREFFFSFTFLDTLIKHNVKLVEQFIQVVPPIIFQLINEAPDYKISEFGDLKFTPNGTNKSIDRRIFSLPVLYSLLHQLPLYTTVFIANLMPENAKEKVRIILQFFSRLGSAIADVISENPFVMEFVFKIWKILSYYRPFVVEAYFPKIWKQFLVVLTLENRDVALHTALDFFTHFFSQEDHQKSFPQEICALVYDHVFTLLQRNTPYMVFPLLCTVVPFFREKISEWEKPLQRFFPVEDSQISNHKWCHKIHVKQLHIEISLHSKNAAQCNVIYNILLKELEDPKTRAKSRMNLFYFSKIM